MPNRRPRKRSQPHVPLDLERIVLGTKRVEVRMGVEWHIQPMSSANAQKIYRCPGCGRDIPTGQRHVVVWRADSIFGERAVEDRRHWHDSCWRIA